MKKCIYCRIFESCLENHDPSSDGPLEPCAEYCDCRLNPAASRLHAIRELELYLFGGVAEMTRSIYERARRAYSEVRITRQAAPTLSSEAEREGIVIGQIITNTQTGEDEYREWGAPAMVSPSAAGMWVEGEPPIAIDRQAFLCDTKNGLCVGVAYNDSIHFTAGFQDQKIFRHAVINPPEVSE